MMERVNRLWEHPVYQEHLQKVLRWEEERKFCRHNVEHFLDVARILQLLVLEAQLDISREVIYGTALLHDIGRHLQYEEGIPHEKAGAVIADGLLKECGFDEKERSLILEAILNHRSRGRAQDFAALFYRADKQSRSCFCCPVCAECNWPEEKKNLQIEY